MRSLASRCLALCKCKMWSAIWEQKPYRQCADGRDRFWSNFQESFARFAHQKTLQTAVLGESIGNMIARDAMIAADLAHIEEWHEKMSLELENESGELREGLNNLQMVLEQEKLLSKDLRQRSAIAEDDASRLRDEVKQLRKALGTARADAMSYQAKADHLELEYKSMQDLRSFADSEMSQRLSDAERERDEAQQRAEALQQQVTDVETLLASDAGTTIAKLEQDLADSRCQLAAAEAMRDELEMELAAYEDGAKENYDSPIQYSGKQGKRQIEGGSRRALGAYNA